MKLHSAAALLFVVVFASTASAADLRKEDNRQFDEYTRRVERELERRATSRILSVFDNPRQRASRTPTIESASDPNPRDIGSAYIHDWAGATFIPGAKASQVVAILRDYARHKEIYAPEVVDSRLISANGETTRSYLRLKKEKFVTVILDSEYESTFRELSPDRGMSFSHSTSIREVENPGRSNEKALPAGTGNGFLWRLNAYWVWAESDGGVWLECRAISLTRDVPTGLGWMVQPIIRSLPRESLEATLENTRKAVLAGLGK